MKTSAGIIIDIIHHHFQDVIRIVILVIIKLLRNTQLSVLLIIITKQPIFFPVCYIMYYKRKIDSSYSEKNSEFSQHESNL